MLEGIGQTAEEKLVTLEPLIAFYEQEMGSLPGRLMLAVNFLRDAQTMKTDLKPEVQAAIEQAEALTMSVMTRLLAMAEDAGNDCESKDQVQAWLSNLKA